ncbi:MAG: transcriptional regulator, LuxR family [Rhizobacter sp.]|nr:transcriptional regulator, LuxR family [Rhizobacter sp.]
MKDAAFDDIVAGFYRAAGGAIGWVDALTPFQRELSAWAIYVHAIDRAQGRVAYTYNASDLTVEPDLDYIRTYHRIDPRANLILGLAAGEWFNCWETFDEEFVARDRFYQDFLIPYGGRYASGTKLIEDESVTVILGVHRSLASRRLDADEIDVCKRLARHLSDALRAHGAMARHRPEGLLGVELLSRLRAPVALIDDERRVLHANPAAQALLLRHSCVAVSADRLHCRRPHDDGQLLVALRRLLWADSSRHGGPPCDKLYMKIEGQAGGDALGLALHALRPAETLRAFGDRPLAMALFHEVGARLRLDPFVVAAAFNLTPGEARIAVAVARGATADDMARDHGVSVNTVRTQLKSVFGKTGTTRQADLVSMMAGLSMVDLAGPAGSG